MTEIRKSFAETMEEPDKGEVIDPPPPSGSTAATANVFREVLSFRDMKTKCVLRGRNPQYAKGDVICFTRGRGTVNGKPRVMVQNPRRC